MFIQALNISRQKWLKLKFDNTWRAQPPWERNTIGDKRWRKGKHRLKYTHRPVCNFHKPPLKADVNL